MRILTFAEGMILMRGEAVGLARKEIVWQIQQDRVRLLRYSCHAPAGSVVRRPG